MSDGSRDEGIGRRVAQARKRRSLTQEGLAQRSSFARSHIAQVEKGHKVATPAFLAAVAKALQVDPAELTGQPYRGTSARDDQVHAAIPEIRRALATMDVPMDLEAPARGLDELAGEAETLRRLSMAARHTQVGARLPAVLVELGAHVNDTGSARAWTLLNATQAIAASLARRLGYNDLAHLAIRSAADAAAHGDDPNLPRLAQLSRALLMLTIGAWDQGLALVRRTGEQVERDTPQATAVFGALQLRAALLSARAANAGAAWEHYGRAADAVRELPENVGDFYALQFNHANVALHGAAVAVELHDLDEATRRDHTVRPVLGSLPAERRAHHEIDMSRVHAELNEPQRALQRLLAAERIAPQMTRYHPSARALVEHLVDMRRALPESLHGLHNRMRLA